MNLKTSTPSPSALNLLLLAPASASIPSQFRRVDVNAPRYEIYLREMQRLRGSVYLRDGAIDESHLIEGCHIVPADAASWHLLALAQDGSLCGCARYRQYPRGADFQHLGVSKAAVAQSDLWGVRLRSVVEQGLAEARRSERNFVEVGGWAVRDSFRFTSAALRIALSTYALAEMLGGCIGITTATLRNCSSQILRRIGGRSLEHQGAEIPAYYDPRHKCQMEVLRFDSYRPSPKFTGWVHSLMHQMADVLVLTPPPHPSAASSHQHSMFVFGPSPGIPGLLPEFAS